MFLCRLSEQVKIFSEPEEEGQKEGGGWGEDLASPRR